MAFISAAAADIGRDLAIPHRKAWRVVDGGCRQTGHMRACRVGCCPAIGRGVGDVRRTIDRGRTTGLIPATQRECGGAVGIRPRQEADLCGGIKQQGVVVRYALNRCPGRAAAG